MNSAPNASPEQEPTGSEKLPQPAEHTPPSTPPSITGSMDELGERLEAKNEADETDTLATEESA